MCIKWNNEEWEEAKEDIQAYKIVIKITDGKYKSPLSIDKRVSQDIGGSSGTILEYETGKTITSKWPGIYLIKQPVNIQRPQLLLKVTIPKGTKFRRGIAKIGDIKGTVVTLSTINAMKIIVGKERPNQETNWVGYCDISNSSTDTDTSTYNIPYWGYSVASSITTSITTNYTQD